MNYLDLYLQHFLKIIIKNNINDYRSLLDDKLQSMERYIKYLKNKKEKINTLIDSLSATLENKYIDMINTYNIKNAQEVHNYEIDLLKQRLDKFEAYYAKIEANIHRCTKERIAAEEQYAIIEQMSYVA